MNTEIPEGRIYSPGANAMLAPYACIAEQSRGRLVEELASPGRSMFQRDRDRVIHSAAFRRLEYKTQVFVYHEGDHYRTRLTHSLEVGQLARSIARELALDEDLAESIALAHDLGHTPFGHAGEDALDSVMVRYGGFDHNAQTIRILTSLEGIYANFDGLNLTWECLEGIAKHNGPAKPKKGKTLPRALVEYNKNHDLELDSYSSLEAQVANIADDIAYNNHDLEDGFRAGLFQLDALKKLPMIGEMLDEVQKLHPDLSPSRLMHEAKRRVIGMMVWDIVTNTTTNIDEFSIKHVDDVRKAGRPIVCLSEPIAADLNVIKQFLFDNMYRHYRVNRMTAKAHRIIRDLFDFFMHEPQCLPPEWLSAYRKQTTEQDQAVVIADYIAGMTDRFATLEHKRLFDLTHQLIGS